MNKIRITAFLVLLSVIFTACSDISNTASNNEKEGIYLETSFSARNLALPYMLPEDVVYGAVIFCKDKATDQNRYLFSKGLPDWDSSISYLILNESLDTDDTDKLRFIYDSNYVTDAENDYTIQLYVFKKASPEVFSYEIGNSLASGSGTFKLKKNQARIDIGKITVTPSAVTESGYNGNGYVDLGFYWDGTSPLSNYNKALNPCNIYKISYDDDGKKQREMVSGKFNLTKNISFFTIKNSLSSGVPAGQYEVDIDFGTYEKYDEENPDDIIETIPLTIKSTQKTFYFYVYQGLTTDCWYNYDGTPVLDDDFNPAKIKLEYALQKEFYVRGENSDWFANAGSEQGKDTADGSIKNPLKTMNQVLLNCKPVDDETSTEYTIYVDGEFSLKDPYSILVNIPAYNNVDINIVGLQSKNPAVFDAQKEGSRTKCIYFYKADEDAENPDSTLTLKNLEIKNAYATKNSNGAGIIVNTGCLRLSNVYVHDNKTEVTGSDGNGAGIYVAADAELMLTGPNIIKDNYKVLADKSEVPSNVYLPKSSSEQKKMIVDGSISGSEIWVTTEDKPKLNDNGTGIERVTITQGYQTSNSMKYVSMFNSDEGYYVGSDSGKTEAALVCSGGNISVSVEDPIVFNTSDALLFEPGKENSFTFTAKNGTSSVTNSISSPIYMLYCRGEEVSKDYYSLTKISSGYSLVLKNKLPEDCYVFNIRSNYDDRAYSGEFNIYPNYAKYCTNFAGNSSKKLDLLCKDKEDLQALGGKNLSYVNVTLKNDIDLNTAEWNPIENVINSTIDGAGYVISNINATGSETVGAFIKILGNNSEIKNLTIKGEARTAGFVYKVSSNTKIVNCINYANVTSANTECGGFVAYHTGTPGNYIFNAYIINCINYGEIKNTSSSDSYAGGIGGYPYQLHYLNCSNYGKVNGNKYVGGICGRGYNSNVYNCANYGSVTTGSSGYAGGISGNSGSFSNVVNYGTVSAVGTYGYIEGSTSGNGYALSTSVENPSSARDKNNVYQFDAENKVINLSNRDLVTLLNNNPPSGLGGYSAKPWIYKDGKAVLDYSK